MLGIDIVGVEAQLLGGRHAGVDRVEDVADKMPRLLGVLVGDAHEGLLEDLSGGHEGNQGIPEGGQHLLDRDTALLGFRNLDCLVQLSGVFAIDLLALVDGLTGNGGVEKREPLDGLHDGPGIEAEPVQVAEQANEEDVGNGVVHPLDREERPICLRMDALGHPIGFIADVQVVENVGVVVQVVEEGLPAGRFPLDLSEQSLGGTRFVLGDPVIADEPGEFGVRGLDCGTHFLPGVLGLVGAIRDADLLKDEVLQKIRNGEVDAAGVCRLEYLVGFLL